MKLALLRQLLRNLQHRLFRNSLASWFRDQHGMDAGKSVPEGVPDRRYGCAHLSRTQTASLVIAPLIMREIPKGFLFRNSSGKAASGNCW